MTVTATETEERDVSIIGAFDEQCFDRLTATGEPALVRAKREEGFHAYRSMAAPTQFDEEWRRTNPAQFPFGALTPLPRIPQNGSADPGPWDDAFDVVVSVGDESFSIQDRTGVLGNEQVFVMPLSEAAESFPDLVREHVRGSALPSDWDKFVALNGAFWNFGLFIHIPPRVELGQGILVQYRLTSRDSVLVPQLVIVAGEQSRATVVETTVSPDDAAFLSVSTKELYVGDAAKLKVISLQEWGRSAYQIGNDMARVGRDAQVDWIALNFGTQLSKLKFGSDVVGEGASAELDGLFFCDDDQHVDQKTLQIHSAPHTYSRLLYKGAVQDEGHSVYQGIIQARPGAVKVDAYQTNNNLVLSDGAQADTIPGLLIDADDLKCSHGATIGNLNEEHVFYLRSRGLPESEARRILIRGFFDEVADRIPYKGIRERVHQLIDAKLNRAAEGA